MEDFHEKFETMNRDWRLHAEGASTVELLRQHVKWIMPYLNAGDPSLPAEAIKLQGWIRNLDFQGIAVNDHDVICRSIDRAVASLVVFPPDIETGRDTLVELLQFLDHATGDA